MVQAQKEKKEKMKILSIGCAFLMLTLIAIFFTFCSEDSQPQETIIATVGDSKISFKELEVSFWLNPQYAIRTPLREARRSQLNYLINEKYYLLTAKAVKLDEDPIIQKRIEYIRKNELLKAYIHQKFLDTLEVSEPELIRGLAKFNKKVKVQNLFVPTEEEARRIKSRLDRGESFEALAREIYEDEPLNSSGGEIGYISFGDLDEDLEKAVYSMKAGEISEPVASRYGYHIVRVLDIREDLLKSKMSNAFKIQTVSEIIHNRKADAQIRSYLKSLAGESKIQINNRILDILVEEINSAMGAKYAQTQLFMPPINQRELASIQNGVTDLLDQPLMIFNSKMLTVRDFLNRIEEMPPLQRPYLHTRRQAIQFIIDMVRMDLLQKEALEAKLNNSAEARDTIKKHIDDLLTYECKKRIRSPEYQQLYPDKWKHLKDIFFSIRQTTPVKTQDENLFKDVANPDSILTDPPIPLLIKNRYVW
jgi:hypothetical protein